MANKVKFGLKNVYIALIDAEGKYGTPKHLDGAISLTLDADGDETVVYAEDRKYWSQTANNGYTGSIEFSVLDEADKASLMGWYVDANDNTVEDADAKPAHFALMAQMSGDVKDRRICLYDGVCSRPGESASTNEAGPTVQSDTMNVTFVPKTFEIKSGETTITKSVVKLSCFKGDPSYETFFDAVVEPAAPKANA